jgi:proteasome alpha subunit
MSLPFYVPPEQLIKDRSDFAKTGVAKGRPVIILACVEGILLVTENSSQSLRKIAEIYDRIAFAGVGRYNEFEALRVAGIRYADLRGYAYDRTDVSGRAVAAAYAQTLGAVFTGEPKPLEVELAVVEVGATAQDDQIFRISFDGSVVEANGLLVIGGEAEELTAGLRADLPALPHLAAGLSLVVADKDLTVIEAAWLRRSGKRRAFERLTSAQICQLISANPTGEAANPGEA